MRPRAPGDEGMPIGFAHRGGRVGAGENTIAAFTRALALGATGLESDVWLTADGRPVLDHDGVVRTGFRRHPIGELGRSDLPAHLPTLDELYQSCGTGFELSLDLKDGAAAAAVAEVASAAGALDRLWLCHPDPAVLTAWRTQAPDAAAVWSTSLGASNGGWAEAVSRAQRSGIDALNLRARQWSPEAIAATHAAGVLAFAWDAQRPATLRRLLDAGADAVYSDHVGRMVAALAHVRPPPDH